MAFLKLGSRSPLNRSEAWACFTANLAMPGSGSLAAGRMVGYWQMAAAFLGLIVSLVAAAPMFKWWASVGAAAAQPHMDEPFQPMLELWAHVRWPLAGIGLFMAAFFWAIATSLDILAKTPKQPVPPRMN